MIAFGLDPRQAHQIVDYALHAPRFAVDGFAEAGTEAVVQRTFLCQRFPIADQRGERGTKFMAGVGDEIRAHPLGRDDVAAVGQTDQHLARPNAVDAEPPWPVGRADSYHIG